MRISSFHFHSFVLSEICASTPLSHNTIDNVSDNARYALVYKVLQLDSFNKQCSEETNPSGKTSALQARLMFQHERRLKSQTSVATPKRVFRSNTHHTDILKHLNDGWVHEIVAWAVVEESLNDRLEEEIPHYVAIVELILQTNDSPHEAQST